MKITRQELKELNEIGRVEITCRLGVRTWEDIIEVED